MSIKNEFKKDKIGMILIFLLILTVFAVPDFGEFNIVIRIVAILFMGMRFMRSTVKGKINVVYLLWVMMFIGICLFNTLLSKNLGDSLDALITLIQALLISYLMFYWAFSKERFNFLLMSICMCSCILCFRTIFNLDMNRFGTVKLGYILGINSNALALRFCFATILSLYMFTTTRNKLRIWYGIAFFLNVILVLITGSRRALAMSLISCILYLIMKANNSAKIIKSMIVIVLFSLCILWLLKYNESIYNIIGVKFFNMLEKLISSGSILGENRDQMIKEGINYFIQRPIFGWGIGTWSSVTGSSLPYAHNNYVELLFATGIIGFIVYYFIFAYIIRRCQVLGSISIEFKSLNIAMIIALLLSDIAASNYNSLCSLLMIAILMIQIRLGTKYMIKREENNE